MCPRSVPQTRARRLLSELDSHRRGLVLAFVLVVIGALAQAAGPWLIGRAIDEDILGRDPSGLFSTMLLLLAVYVASTLAQRGQILRVGAIGQSVLASLRSRIFDRLQHLPLGCFDRRPAGDLMGRITDDVDTHTEAVIQEALGKLLAWRTSVVIAHRLSTVRNAGHLLVIEDGRIAERGTHASLLAASDLRRPLPLSVS